MYQHFVKRIIDIALSVIGIICLMPLLLLICFILLFINSGSLFFNQERAGTLGRKFKMLKFKTMRDGLIDANEEQTDLHRLTTFGNFLRKYSLDELPQLWNVLKGEMSLIGPRPLLLEYENLYNTVQAGRSAVRPGMTGYAQVNGRNELSWERKFELDIYYVKNISFLLDCKIMLKTFFIIGRRSGINSSPMISMEKFKGSIL